MYLYVMCLLIGKGDIFGESVQEIYLSKRLKTTRGQYGIQPVISVSEGQRSAMGKSCYAVSALSYCDLHKISLSDLAAILDVYPEFASQFLHSFYITFNLRQVRLTPRFLRRVLSSQHKLAYFLH